MTEPKKRFLSAVTLKELLGFLGVVGSLVFVGLEIRNNTMAARAEAYQQMGSSLADLWLNTSANPEHALLTMRFFEDSTVVFTPAEEAVLIGQSIAAMRLLEITWREVRLGLIDPVMLNAFGWDTEPRKAFTANCRRIWPRMAQNMSPDFRAYIESGFFEPK